MANNIPTYAKNKNLDMWGRPYEDSKFQWLPAPFDVDDAGHVTIAGPVHNLARNENEGPLQGYRKAICRVPTSF